MSYPRIGFACLWNSSEFTTWSHTPWHLRAALRQQADVVDVGVRLGRIQQAGLKGLHARVRAGRPTTTWRQSSLTDAICRREISRNTARAGCDAVLEIQDLAPLELPFFLYQDMSFDALLSLPDQDRLPSFLGLSGSDLRRRHERQRHIYARATGVLAMSHWLARNLVEVSGLDPARVHVVHPGISATFDEAVELPERTGPRRRLLFVGGDFHRKGGDLVVDALAILRREVDPAITLTVAGPAQWPLPGEVPAGVTFLGRRPLSEVAGLYDTHDLFVMPSRLEAFGIAFAEAAARGMPCIGRNAFAMPETIEPGVTGAMVDGDDPVDLAHTIAKALQDDALFAACSDRAPRFAEEFSWASAARSALAAINTTLAR